MAERLRVGDVMSGETEKDISGWTVDTLHSHVTTQLSDFRRMLQERYETQTKAVDAAFLAQQTAMQTALTAAERAVQTALLSAEKAVVKAEVAADKRFEATNEFRAQLNDIVNTLISRKEADTRFEALGEKVDGIADRGLERVTALERLLENRQGQDAATIRDKADNRLNNGQMLAFGVAIIALVGLVMSLVTR